MSEPQSGARRYPRTFGGLIGSMIVLVLVVVAFVVVRGLFRDTPEIHPEAVDYRGTVATVQEAGYTVAYPSSLPSDWIARDPLFTPGDRPTWGLPMLTEDGRFVGIQQQDAPLSDLLDTYVPNGARQGEDVRLESGLGSAVGPTWTSWSDGKRDHAFATELGGDTLLVYGSASVEDLETLVRLLTVAPVR